MEAAGVGVGGSGAAAALGAGRKGDAGCALGSGAFFSHAEALSRSRAQSPRARVCEPKH
jgi:hypothetical protein